MRRHFEHSEKETKQAASRQAPSASQTPFNDLDFHYAAADVSPAFLRVFITMRDNRLRGWKTWMHLKIRLRRPGEVLGN